VALGDCVENALLLAKTVSGNMTLAET